jgi:hypothetical protein
VLLSKRTALSLTLVLAIAASLALTQMAGATHPRPKGATPLRASLAIAYSACASPNRQHGAPLATLSCNPPAQASSFLTVGTGDAWAGTNPKAIGSVRFDVKVSSPEDVKIVASISDVRCRGNSVSGFCGNANTDNATLPDYGGELNGNLFVRLTDHFSGPIGSCGTCADPATAQDVQISVGTPCFNTTDTTVGATCRIDTSANGVILGAVQDNKRANLEAQTIYVDDGGSDGTAATTFDNTKFATQGIWIP